MWFVPLARQQDCILEYILPTKPKRANGCQQRIYQSIKLSMRAFLSILTLLL
ncbi:unknown protein [Microcystis aeruginosa NIES-843]|uniref:Uncharacterized protein n=1 Tax=Microcystis aeruginosa (strain NIES-843 / IAM M-2473) TaxID=449447 RepID=B0JUH4_MICAN|nr:unknown protein [Microcystis aeruginosa NIES-843]